jgi:predicted ribosome-associated RNA-binding protein Tma20
LTVTGTGSGVILGQDAQVISLSPVTTVTSTLVNCVIREWKSRTEESKFFGIEFTVDDKDDKEEIDYVDDEMMVMTDFGYQLFSLVYFLRLKSSQT